MLDNVSHKKTFTQSLHRKRAPIEYYMQKISLIKNDPLQVTTFYQEPEMKSHTNFASSFCDLKEHHQSQLQQKKKNYQKKRSLSTKTEIQFSGYPKLSHIKTNTQYDHGKHFQPTQINLFSKIQDSKERLKGRTLSNFKANTQKMKELGQGKRYLSVKKIETEPSESCILQKSKRMVTEWHNQSSGHHQEMCTIREQVEQNFETVKQIIFQKISSYVKSLDEKGEQELNQMLTGNYKRHIKCHSDVVLYEEKIGRMIKTNKEIVKMLKEEFLSPRKGQQFSERSMFGKKQSQNNLETQLLQSPIKRITNDEIQVSLQMSNEPKRKQTMPNNLTKPIGMENQSKANVKQELLRSQLLVPQDYSQEMNHVTSQFVNQWQKSKLHKKQIYQKLRKTLFKKFPHYKQRQQRRNQQLGIKSNQNHETFSDFSDDENNDIFNSKLPFEISKNLQTKNQQRYAQQKGHEHMKEDHSLNTKNRQLIFHSQQKQMQTVKTSVKNERDEVLPLKQTISELSKSISKVTLLSKRNSLSKGSGKTLSVYTAEDKKQVKRINFQNLVEFIFKRAFFYSVSKKRIIENRTEKTPIEIVSPIEEKKPDFSFIKYNSKAEEKKYLRMAKLNEKKLRATGAFLIKNKYNIMEMQEEGRKEYDFLRRCIQEAISDYVILFHMFMAFLLCISLLILGLKVF